MNITPNKLTIAQLFATTNEQFIVPSYQRRYAWGHNQYMALYEDIEMLKENDGHLFGMMILHSGIHTGGLNKPEIIDGQQRITTLIILLKAFETTYRKMGKTEKAKEIRKMVLCKDLRENEKPKIMLGDLDNPDIEQLIMTEETDGLTNENIKSAYLSYIELLNSLAVENVNTLFYKLTNVAVIIRLDVGMAQDAYKLFETINNRGLRLTPTDIIKNFLLGHAAKINEENTLSTVKTLWANIIRNMDSIDSDDFLRQYMCSVLHRKISMSKLVPEFKKYYMKHIESAELLGEYEYYQGTDTYLYSEEEEEEEDNGNDDGVVLHEENEYRKISITDFIRTLESLSIIYRKISLATFEKQKINRRIQGLNYIRSKPAYIFLMHFMKQDLYEDKEKIAVLKYIETLMLRRHICEKRTSENDDIFSKLVPLIGELDICQRVKDSVESGDFIPDDNEFAIMLPKHQFKGKLIDRAKYLLECLEYYERGDTGELVLSSSDEVHLEHIIPQTIGTKKSKEEYGNWETYLGDKSRAKHKKYVNYIGNMTLLGESLNIQAYNNPFAKKKGSYKKSNFLITKKLAEQNDFRFNQVDKRSEYITQKALEIWGIS